MTALLDHLNRDTLPPALLEDFIAWCVWEQARPALVSILDLTGLSRQAQSIAGVDDYVALAANAEEAARHVAEVRKITGPLGLSTAEAAAFLTYRLASAAADSDAEDVAFFAVQLQGWQQFAKSNFQDAQGKIAAEDSARHAQEAQLQSLWMKYSINSDMR